MFQTALISLLAFITPLFFWTLTPNFFTTPKELFFVVAIVTLLISLAIRTLKTRDLPLYSSPLTIPLIVFILTIIASLVFNPEGRPEALAGKGLTLILLPLMSLILLTTTHPVKLKHWISTALLSATTILSLHSLLSLSFLSRSPFVPAFMQNVSFTPSGSYLTTLALIIIGLTLSITLLKQSSLTLKNTAAALIVLHTITIVAIVSLMLPGGSLSPTLLPYGASWSIALDALKSIRSLFFGIGISNYSLLYTSVKPLSINATQFWNAIPSTGASELLTLLPTAGILSTLSFLFLMSKGLIWTKDHDFNLAFIATSLAFLIIPASLPLYLLFFLFLALAAPRNREETTLSKGTARLLAGLIVLGSTIVIISTGRVYASELLLERSRLAIASGDSQRAYDLHLLSIRYSPKMTSYHLSFAEINFRLASALSQKTDLTDADREIITQLIQQSILSNKRALELRPNSAASWISLAKIYQNLINVADQADRFSLDYYANAISLDRANPLLRLEYGNLLSQLSIAQESGSRKAELAQRAKTEYQTAIQLKPDYANAYFNLAKLSESEGDYPSAVTAMSQVVKYLDPSTTDYAQAVAELETMKAKLPKATPTPAPEPNIPSATTELTEPSPLPSPLPGGPLELPQS